MEDHKDDGFMLIALIAIGIWIVAIAAMISAALAQGGHHGHAQFHDQFYQGLTHRGFSCCSGADCRPTSSRTNGDHYEVLVDGEWMVVPSDKILKVAAPDGGTHVCAPPQTGVTKGIIYCVVLPAEG